MQINQYIYFFINKGAMRSRATAIFLFQVEICLAGARLLATFGGSNAPWLHLICQKQTRRQRRKEEEDDEAAAAGGPTLATGVLIFKSILYTYIVYRLVS